MTERWQPRRPKRGPCNVRHSEVGSRRLGRYRRLVREPIWCGYRLRSHCENSAVACVRGDEQRNSGGCEGLVSERRPGRSGG